MESVNQSTSNLYFGTGTLSDGVSAEFECAPASHGCRCYICAELNERDERSLALARRYLSRELGYSEYRRAQVAKCGQLAPKFASSLAKHPCDLNDAIEFAMFEAEFDDSGNHTNENFERKFRLLLCGIVHGYETRKRDVHYWEPGDGSKSPCLT